MGPSRGASDALRVPGVKKIAVLRAGGIGDFIFTLPALESLRAAYPGAEITLLGAEWHARFLDGRPGPVDRALAVPPSTGVNGPDTRVAEDGEGLELFFGRMRAEGFDLALQMHGGGGYSNPFVLRLGARVTAGPRSPGAAPLERSVPYYLHQPEVLRHLEVAGLAGAGLVTVEPRLPLVAEDLAEAVRELPESDAPLAALNPGAGDPRRRWPPEKLAAVGDALAGAGARVVVVGAEGDRPLTSQVVEAMRTDAADLSGRLSLGGLAGLLSRCAVVVSNDSGPLHLAAAVGAATVGIYWGPNLITAGPATRTRHRPVLSWRAVCPVCGASLFDGDCGHQVSVVADVSVEEVAGSALDLLRESSAGADHRAATSGPG